MHDVPSLVCGSCAPSSSQDEMSLQLRVNSEGCYTHYNERLDQTVQWSSVYSVTLKDGAELLTWQFRWRDALPVLVGQLLEVSQTAAETQNGVCRDAPI